MGARATFTQAQIERAIRAATKLGKVAVQTQMGIAFVDPASVTQDEAKDAVEGWFSARQAAGHQQGPQDAGVRRKG
jgi:hypothetical protein